jgi:hypothetical protein
LGVFALKANHFESMSLIFLTLSFFVLGLTASVNDTTNLLMS